MFDKEEKRLRVGHRRRRRAGTQRHAEVTTESTNARRLRRGQYSPVVSDRSKEETLTQREAICRRNRNNDAHLSSLSLALHGIAHSAFLSRGVFQKKSL